MICVNKNNFCYVIIIAVLDSYKIDVTPITITIISIFVEKKMIEKYCVYPSITFIFWVKVLRDSPQEVCQLV